MLLRKFMLFSMDGKSTIIKRVETGTTIVACALTWAGIIATVFNSYAAWTGKDKDWSRTEYSSLEGGIFTNIKVESFSYLLWSEFLRKKSTFYPAEGLICLSREQLTTALFLPYPERNSSCRPILDTDLPLLQGFAKAAGYTGKIEARFVPTMTKSFTTETLTP